MYHGTVLRLERSQGWRDKAKPSEFDFDSMDWGKDDDDPFRLDAATAPAKIKNKKG